MSSNQARIAILGAGFSGLTLARALAKKEFQVEVFEAKARAGGLIESRNQGVLVESAAHAILASQEVEKLFEDLKVEGLEAGHRSQSKWIFRGRPRNIPLSGFEIFKSFLFFVISKIRRNLAPQPSETVAQWIRSRIGREANDYLISPALQGIYGATSDHLSAPLIIGGMMSRELRVAKGLKRGSLAPRNGIQELIDQLVHSLSERGIVIHFHSKKTLEELQSQFDAVVVATSVHQAGLVLSATAPELAQNLVNLPRVSLVTTTIGYEKPARNIRGFGCLFPSSEKFKSLGVIFNTDLFANRGEMESETWILSGDVLSKSDEEILSVLRSDRERAGFAPVDIRFSEIVRWSSVLPLYGEKLETLLASSLFQKKESISAHSSLETFLQGARARESEKPLYLTGNYLGGIGLTKILSYNERLAQRMQNELRSAE
jgi:oxygen-dependent protoporphyrinogen oxidase